MNVSITKHEGKKYIRTIHEAVLAEGRPVRSVEIDVYCVLEAFDVRCPAVAHAIKKLLAPGQRGKGDRLADLRGAVAALHRAIDLERVRTSPPASENAASIAATLNGCWETVAAADGSCVVGYVVRFSVPDAEGRYLWVGHYYAGGGPDGPSLGWCEVAAESHAKRLNKEGKLPAEFRDGRWAATPK